METSSYPSANNKVPIFITIVVILCFIVVLLVIFLSLGTGKGGTGPSLFGIPLLPNTQTQQNSSVNRGMVDRPILFSANEIATGSNSGRLTAYIIFPSGQAKALTSQSDPSGIHDSLNATFSPDEKKVAFVTLTDTIVLATMNSDGSNKQVVSHLKGYKILPSWSPDGSKILYVLNTLGSGSGIVQLELSTGKETLLSTGKGIAQNPAWLADGSGFSFISLEINPDGTLAKRHLMVYKGNRTSEIAIKFNGAVLDNVITPVFSPDGNRIVFSRDTDDQIYVMNGDGNNVKALTSPGASKAIYSCPSWSPDGKYIVADEVDKATNNEYVAKVDALNGGSTHFNIVGYSKINCPRVARY